MTRSCALEVRTNVYAVMQNPLDDSLGGAG